MTIKIESLSEQANDDPLLLLDYGGSGTGKTHFAGTFGSRSLIINLTHGLKTLRSPKFTNTYGNINPIVATIVEGNDLSRQPPTVIDQINDTIDEMLNTRGDEFDTIIIDDCLNLRVNAMRMALQVNHDLDKSKSLLSTRKYGFFTVAVQDYGQEMAIIEWFFRELIETCKVRKKNLVVLAHERIEHGKAPSIGAQQPIIQIRPMFTGVNTDIGAMFDYVWYMTAEGSGDQMKVIARTVQTDTIEAKTRDGGLFPECYFNPNWPEMKNALDYFKTTGKLPDHKTFFKRN